jgi:hypothetical protein
VFSRLGSNFASKSMGLDWTADEKKNPLFIDAGKIGDID